MTEKRAIIDAEVDARAQEFGLDAATLRRTRAALRRTEWAVSALLAIGAGVVISVVVLSGAVDEELDFLRLLGASVVGLTANFILLHAGSFGERYLPGTALKATALGLTSGAIVTSAYLIMNAFGWRIEALVGLCVAALTTLSLTLSGPKAALISLQADRPSLPIDMAYLLGLPPWQTSLDGRFGRLAWLGVLSASGLITEVVAVYLAPQATVAFVIASTIIAVVLFLLRRRPGTVLALAALYPVVVVVLAVLIG